MNVRFHFHPKLEVKVIKQHLINAALIVAALAVLYFLSVVWNTYTEAFDNYQALEAVHYFDQKGWKDDGE